TADKPKKKYWMLVECVDLDSKDLKPYNSQKIPDYTRKIEMVIDFKPDEKNVTRGFINNATHKIDVKYPTLNKVYDGITEFDADQVAFIIEKEEIIDIILISGNETTPDYNNLNTIDPIERDTTTIPADGWTILRFVADNPGVWGFHCHIEVI
ncbi:14322_t:CDS:2, partial [Racocetra persica]